MHPTCIEGKHHRSEEQAPKRAAKAKKIEVEGDNKTQVRQMK